MIVLNSSWNLLNFRSGLIRALLDAGFEVVAVAPRDDYSSRVEALGCKYVPIRIDSKGTNPLRDAILLFGFHRIMAAQRPDVVLTFTVKPNIYASIAARSLRIPVIQNVAGLGTVFGRSNWLTWLVTRLYKHALQGSPLVFFQNEEDRSLFLHHKLVHHHNTRRLPGSGVDVRHFRPLPLRKEPDVRFLLIARLLWDKGVGIYVEAARAMRARGLNVECQLLGFVDSDNPSAISKEQIRIWHDEGCIRYLGASDDVRIQLEQADCVVLPSFYREGVPRSLLEAAACARPIITTDNIGCREVVDDGVNGFLCVPRNATDLASKMQRFVDLPHEQRQLMAMNSRRKAEEGFAETRVTDEYLAVLGMLRPTGQT